MAVTVTQIGRRTVFGDRRVGFYDVAFSGNYATGGEAVTPGLFGLNDIDYISSDASTNTATTSAEVLLFNVSTSKVQVFESGAANAPLAEKQNAEAYQAGMSARLMVVGH
jgi:hypothetical protein